MAKSLRSKVKRSFRAKKRVEGVYAATAAARLQRLNSKLVEITKRDVERETPGGDADEAEDVPGWLINALALMPNIRSLQPQDLAYLSGTFPTPTSTYLTA
ncbi:hypothetical protein CC1G_00097 [Coprinopsis cinerea okayama7|uniref:DUF2423 domain-containing protein n=1 Tax=Coprinopsis cinerea (strain Okayama-7 / 130 / ATCC MYA-4618 / FGSC 9003) TaxID=240176 RepID=A8NWR0_COPC7|nr:hypothetical protein CC1G_00097 [Coprinopsis cinerea okayama7\|eukprot:XP_001836961.1 hypothetical protein CC1G_00097 [Coprinopsis cinerea okayama7\